MWSLIFTALLLPVSLNARWTSRQVRSADDGRPIDAADYCKRCDDGDETACDNLVELNLANDGLNVCAQGRSDGTHAPEAEYNGDLFEGDIEMPKSAGRASLTNTVNHWPNAVVPYVIENVFSGTDRATIKSAMKHIEDNTCVRFKQRTNEKAYVKITNTAPSGGCFSALGKAHDYYQPQTLNLGRGCTYTIGTPVHEMLHALGFIHEQNRPDRDQYVWIDWANIIRGKESQYKKMTKGVTTHNTRYDYGSVMHYDDRGFAADRRKPVMIPYTNGATLGQRKGLSQMDIYEVKATYCR